MTASAHPIDWLTVKTALWQWLTDTTGLEVVWANQSAPQPSWPYAAINILPGTLDRGALDDEQWLDTGDLQIVGQRSYVLSIQIRVGPPDVASPDCDGLALLEAALSTLTVPTVVYDLAQSNVAIRDRGQPQNISVVVGADWISAWQSDVFFGLASVLNPDTMQSLADVGYFDKVEISSDIDGLDNPGGGLNLDDEIIP